MKGIRVGCVLGVGQESPAIDDSFCDYHGREKKEHGGCVERFTPYLVSFLVNHISAKHLEARPS